MNGLIAVTDYDWFEFLRQQGDLDEVNGRSYYPLDGQALRLPLNVADRPHRPHLEWHMDERFRR